MNHQQQPETQTPLKQRIVVDDSSAQACYANFCRVASTSEEVILDLGLNPTPAAVGTVNVKVSQRTIMNHYSARRLLRALSIALQHHEHTFGELEVDVRKRVLSEGEIQELTAGDQSSHVASE